MSKNIQYKTFQVDNIPENFKLYYARQDVTDIACDCCVPYDENTVGHGWVKIYVLGKRGNPIVNAPDENGDIYRYVILDGLVHWSIGDNLSDDIHKQYDKLYECI